MYIDKVYETGRVVNESQLEALANSEKWVYHLKEKFGRELPYLIVFKDDKGENIYTQYRPEKRGMPMDWRFFAGYDPITKKDVLEEENVEKRRLLMMEYGITHFFEDVKIIDSDRYGELIASSIDEATQYWVKVIDPQPLSDDKEKYLKKAGLLTEDGKEIVYIPVPDSMTTAREAVAWTFGEEDLPQSGFNQEK